MLKKFRQESSTIVGSLNGLVPEAFGHFFNEVILKYDYRRMEFERAVLSRGIVKAITNMPMYWHMLGEWGSMGMPVFELTKDVAEGFILTDAIKLSLDDIRFPFKSFMIKLPKGVLGCTRTDTGAFEDVEYINFHETLLPPQDWLMKNILDYDLMNAPHSPTWVVRMFSAGGVSGSNTEQKPLSDDDYKRWLLCCHPDGVKKIIGGGKNELQTLFCANQVVINLCMYLSTLEPKSPCLKRSAAGSKKGKPHKGKTPLAKTWVVGSPIKLDPEASMAAKDWVDACHGNRTKWRRTKRSVTRGHWRNQAYGQKWSLRRPKWIHPFVNNKNSKINLTHTYEAN